MEAAHARRREALRCVGGSAATVTHLLQFTSLPGWHERGPTDRPACRAPASHSHPGCIHLFESKRTRNAPTEALGGLIVRLCLHSCRLDSILPMGLREAGICRGPSVVAAILRRLAMNPYCSRFVHTGHSEQYSPLPDKLVLCVLG